MYLNKNKRAVGGITALYKLLNNLMTYLIEQLKLAIVCVEMQTDAIS